MRRVAIAVVVLAVVAGAAAGWWWWRRAMPAPAAARNAARRAATPPQPLPVAELMLQVDGGPAVQVSAGTSVVFTVTLTGTQPEPALRIGAEGRPWSTDLRFETADGKPVGIRIDQLGSPFTSQFLAEATAATKPTPQSDEAIVDGSRLHQVEFGVSPEEATRIGAGTLGLRAVLPLDRNPSGLSQLVSNTVTITVDSPVAGGQSSAETDKRRLEAAARFYLKAEKWADAHRVAMQLVEREAPDAVAYVLLGDALNGLRRDEEALAAYYEAIASLPETLDESPDYVIARMEEVQQRLESSRGQKEPAR